MATRSKNTGALFIAIAVLLVGLLLLFLFAGNRVDWSENYREKDALPYGTSLLQNLLERSAGNRQFKLIEDTLKHSLPNAASAPNSSYILIGRETYLDDDDLEALIDFVDDGNTAYVASHSFSSLFLSTLLYRASDDIDYEELNEELFMEDHTFLDDKGYNRIRREMDTTVTLTLEDHPAQLALTYFDDNKVFMKTWTHFVSDLYTLNEDNVEVLGYMNQLPNFIGVPIGEGMLYLHTTPLAFTNIWLSKKDGFTYANQVFKHLGDGDILWDTFHREFRYMRNSPWRPPAYEHDDGMLAFILSKRELALAWFTLLLAGVLYLIFGARRVQRPIPVISPPRNTSLDFAETIGMMYRGESEHHRLSALKMRLFKAHIRERYHLRSKLQEENPSEFYQRLAEKSHIAESEIEAIFDIYAIIEGRKDPDGAKLIRLHNAIEKFYAHAR